MIPANKNNNAALTREQERMSAAELRVVREYLGLTTRWLADHLGVAERTVHRWEAGSVAIPDGVLIEVERLEEATSRLVADLVSVCEASSTPILLTYRTDQAYRRHRPQETWPASWHRTVVARVAYLVTDLVIDYWTDQT